MSPKISIIIPVYKVADFIEDCLKSIIIQDYRNLEVILVDDASPDNSIDIARHLIDASNRQDMFKVLRHSENRGLSAARNTGIDNASGKYLYFLDSDDSLPEFNTISTLYDSIEGCDVAIGNYRGIKPDSSYISKYNEKCILDGDALIQAFIKGDVPIVAWNKLIHKRLFNSGLRFKEGILNEDELFSYQMLFMNPKVSMAGIVTYNYNIRSGSIMTTFNLDRLLSPVIVYEEAVKSYSAINGDNQAILTNLDHFAFKRYANIVKADVDMETKRQLYRRLRSAQKQTKGVGKMRYLFNGHIYLPASIGFLVMTLVARKYIKSRNL